MYPTLFTTPGVAKFAEEIDAERQRQIAKFGEQHHPDGTGAEYYVGMADEARQDVERFVAQHSGPQWALVLLEEVYEALAESDPARLRAELVQVAAVCAAWVADIDSRTPATEERHVVADSSADPEHTDDCPGCVTAAAEQPAAQTEGEQPTPDSVPRTERALWVDIANALNAAVDAGMPVGIDLDGTLTDRNAWSVVWDAPSGRWAVAGYDGDVEEQPACAKCRTPFDPADTRFDGRARHYDTPYCRGCVDRCHDNEIADHRCVICA
ncbi:hypothetical protein [Streptomyces sp. NPDC002564]|uniref:hypothetical protein n=1 Tax=Streptomyces sp. NPDC002564 TaxID=3364649 RepID=UPI00368EE4E5